MTYSVSFFKKKASSINDFENKYSSVSDEEISKLLKKLNIDDASNPQDIVFTSNIKAGSGTKKVIVHVGVSDKEFTKAKALFNQIGFFGQMADFLPTIYFCKRVNGINIYVEEFLKPLTRQEQQFLEGSKLSPEKIQIGLSDFARNLTPDQEDWFGDLLNKRYKDIEKFLFKAYLDEYHGYNPAFKTNAVSLHKSIQDLYKEDIDVIEITEFLQQAKEFIDKKYKYEDDYKDSRISTSLESFIEYLVDEGISMDQIKKSFKAKQNGELVFADFKVLR